MRLSSLFIVVLSLVVAGCLSIIAANFAVSAIEDQTEIEVRRILDENAFGWAEVQADGLQAILSGTAPDEPARFTALSTVGSVIDASRIIDDMTVTPTAAIAPPRFSAEVLRNDSGISIIGLVPAGTDREALIGRLADMTSDENVTDLLETADYPVPEQWNEALDYALNALARLPRSKVSVQAGRVAITAISDSAEAKAQLEAALLRAAPPGLRLLLDIAAPRPVITPFTLRFILEPAGGYFDACSAETVESRARILAAANGIGLARPATCTIGMGVPSPRWAEAAQKSINALRELGGGSVTMADADITLIAIEGTDPALFDRVVGELETSLPDVFALHPILPVAATNAPTGPPEFVATLSPEGLVQLRGRLTDESLRQMVESYAQARFGSESVYMAARLVEDLPEDWPVRVLAGLEALSYLSNGALTVTPDNLVVTGNTDRENARSDISRLLSDKLGEAEAFSLGINYIAPPEPEDTSPDPFACEARIAEIQKDKGKITFEPGSANVAAESLGTMNDIADILVQCGPIQLEIQGHTDSQGREEMNQKLSQSRAQSVLNALRARRVLTSTFVANGYGESEPIADNGTEDGREANRRIEFRLLIEQTESSEPEDAAGATGPDDAAEAAADTPENGAAGPDDIADVIPEQTPDQDGPAPEETPNEQN